MKKVWKKIKTFLYWITPPSISHKWWKLSWKLKRNVQRFKRGYADTDVWNFCYWYIEMIPKMLTQLKNENHGHPCNLTEEEWNEYLKGVINNLNDAKMYMERASEEIDDKKALELYNKSNECMICSFNMLEERFWDFWD